MKTLKLAALASATVFATPALAVDAYTVFNGVNGTGGFYYGTVSGTTFTDYDVTGTGGACFLPNAPTATCLYSSSSPDGPIPGISKGGTYPTVNYAGATLATHPSNGLDAFAAFRAATTSTYSYSITLQSIGTDTTNGVGVRYFDSNGLGARSVISYPGSITFTGTTALAAGQQLGAIIDANGFYGGDTTALTFSVGVVPEPAQWALMIGGFGVVGGAMRRRRTLVVA
jgi:hypothetical protein